LLLVVQMIVGVAASRERYVLESPVLELPVLELPA
jgi:hypothetical protein